MTVPFEAASRSLSCEDAVPGLGYEQLDILPGSQDIMPTDRPGQSHLTSSDSSLPLSPASKNLEVRIIQTKLLYFTLFPGFLLSRK